MVDTTTTTISEPAPSTGLSAPSVVAPPTGIAPPAEFSIPQEMITWAKAKGLNSFDTWAKDPEAYKMATSYRETEKFIGGDKIPLPKDMNDPVALRGVFEKLGAPKDAKEYKLVVPDGQKTDFADNFRAAAFDANLTGRQAEKLNNWWNGVADQLKQADVQQKSEAAAMEKIGLEKDWGGQYDSNKEVATRAAMKTAGDLGIGRDKLLDGLESALGLRDSMRVLKYLGDHQKVTGDTFEGGEHGANRGGRLAMTPQQAEETKNALFKDKEFANKYRSGDVDSRKRLNDLNAIIASAGQVA